MFTGVCGAQSIALPADDVERSSPLQSLAIAGYFPCCYSLYYCHTQFITRLDVVSSLHLFFKIYLSFKASHLFYIVCSSELDFSCEVLNISLFGLG